MTFQKRRCEPSLDFLSDAWRKCLDAWVLESYQRSGSEETRREYRRTLVAFLSAVQKEPQNVLRQDILDFMYSPCQSDRNKGAEPTIGTTRTRFSIVASFYRYASVYTVAGLDGRPEKLLKVAPPTIGMKTPKATIAIRALSLDELSRLIEAIPTNTLIGKRDLALVMLYTLTARRRSEVATLRMQDIKPAIFDGGQREGRIFHFRGKGHSLEEDKAELPELAYRHIVAYLEASGRLDTIRPEDPIFEPTMNGSKTTMQLTDTSINRRIKTYARKAGLGDNVSLHALRHTSASLRVASGAELLDVMKILRHRSLDHTWRYVQRIANPADKDVVKLEAMFERFS